MVKNILQQIGLEAQRRLDRSYDPTSIGKRWNQMLGLLHPPAPEAESMIIECLEALEVTVRADLHLPTRPCRPFLVVFAHLYQDPKLLALARH